MYYLDKWYFRKKSFEKQIECSKVDFVFELNSCFRSNHECRKIRLFWVIYQFHGVEGGDEDDAKRRRSSSTFNSRK